MPSVDSEIQLKPSDDKLRAFLLEKYRIHSDLVQFYMKFLISANGFYFAIAGGIYTFIVTDFGSYPPYFVLALFIPIIISGAFIYLSVTAMDGAKKLGTAVDELYTELAMRTGPFGHSIYFILWLMLVLHGIFVILTLNVIVDLLRNADAFGVR